MEPRADDGDDEAEVSPVAVVVKPQWSPVLMTGTTRWFRMITHGHLQPQWSPVLMTGTTHRLRVARVPSRRPQWSPVLMTGTT